MRTPIRFLRALALGVAGAMSVATPSIAIPITYTEQATASGSLNGAAFNNVSVTLSMMNNTANVTGGPPVFVNIGTVTLNVAGFSSVTFTDTTQAVSNQTAEDGGFGDNTKDLAILFTGSAAFANYDLATSFGPVSGTAILNLGASFPTTGGAFILTSIANDTSTFTATVTPAIPEPTSLALLGAGLVGLGLIRRRARS